MGGVLHKRTPLQKRTAKKAAKRAHRNTNFSKLKPKAGYLRVKSGSKRYVLKRQSPAQRVSKKIGGRKLGKAKFLR